MRELSDHLKGILDTLPISPGCYIYRDSNRRVIYVGKAVNLRNRVRSYFHAGSQEDAKTRLLVRQIADIEWILVGSELEALILEMNLIKKHRPHFNIRMKDDKRYPYIKVHWQEAYPRVTATRQVATDGARYFGPYTSAWAVYDTLNELRRVFPYLTCDRVITGKDPSACMYYGIKLCNAPCIGAVTKEQYRQNIENLCRFLEGHSEGVLEHTRQTMEQAAEELNFERAAVLRDRLTAMRKIVERQKVVFAADYPDSDFVAMARSDREACVQVFFVRGGKLIGREYFVLEGTEDEPDSEVLSEFLKQFYDQVPTIPQQVMLPEAVEEMAVIREWMNTRRGGDKVEIILPRDGQPEELLKTAAENATRTLAALKAQWEADTNKQSEALAELQNALQLPLPPNRIECYDISNTQGTASVGSMVVFEQGVPSKKLYRRFNIKTVEGPDDYASMEEVLRRRFNRFLAAQEVDQVGEKPDLAFSLLPDLLIVDGGKGQLGRAEAVLERAGLTGKVPLLGLAKQQEEIFRPGVDLSLMLPRNSQALYLLQRIRDEAHRFAITAHRNRRSKQGLVSRLDSIPGIGPARRKALIIRFGSVDGIKQATLEELMSVKGISEEVARNLQSGLE